jgi:pyridoxamine 5'-phosphate oxidase
MAIDPIRRFNRWLGDERRSGTELAEAIALATADRRGRPSVRWMLLKEATKAGFVFYTNEESRKGRELADNPYASIAVYWHRTNHQVRVEGKIRSCSEGDADAYWATRPRQSQLAALASRQSRAVKSRQVLVTEYKALEKRFKGKPVPRPSYWKGYCLVPRTIEFWTRAEPRLHRRELFEKRKDGWHSKILQP